MAGKKKERQQSKQKAKPKKVVTNKGTQDAPIDELPLDLQQRVLDVFRQTGSHLLGEELQSTIQQVKQDLFNRDFTAAFQNDQQRDAYMVRWSPTRALAYAHILNGLPEVKTFLLAPLPASNEYATDKTLDESGTPEVLGTETSIDGSRSTWLSLSRTQSPEDQAQVICIGAGGGAELVAFAALHRHIAHPPSSTSTASTSVPPNLLLLDIADWSNALASLQSALPLILSPFSHSSTPPSLSLSSPASSPPTQAKDLPLPSYKFLTHNILCPCPTGSASPFSLPVSSIPFAPLLITIFFTLNELYSTSLPLTTTFLLSLTPFLPPGSLLIVIDSPGSYSSVQLNTSSLSSSTPENSTEPKQEKRYPMHYLLDHTLLTTAKSGSGDGVEAVWEKVVTKESEWFRLPKEGALRYPLRLEDMRFQLHLYRRL